MSGCGISSDHDGNLYLSTANGPFDAFGEEPGSNFSDSIVKLKPGCTRNYAGGLLHSESARPGWRKDDLDLGSTGVLLLPDQPGPYPHLAVASGKNGHIYVMNRDSLGGYFSGGRGQSAGGAGNLRPVEAADGDAGLLEWAALFRSRHQSPERRNQGIQSSQRCCLRRSPTPKAPPIYHLTRSTVSVSANGNGNGIVWAVDNDAYYSAHPGCGGAARLRRAGILPVNCTTPISAPARDNPGTGREIHRADDRRRQSFRWNRRPGERLRSARSRELAAAIVRRLVVPHKSVSSRTRAVLSDAMMESRSS